MAHNITITIPQPVLQSGQNFHVRYRLLPSGAWNDIGNKTNAAFTITGLADGDYELEVTVVDVDGHSDCPSIIYDFSLSSPACACLTDLNGVVLQATANQYQVKLTFTLPTTQPACGWKIDLTNPNGTITSSNYSTLTSPLIIPVAVNGPYYVSVYANCCENRLQLCGSVDMMPASTVTCTGAEFGPNEDQRRTFFINGQWFLKVICTAQSTPVTTSFYLTYSQNNVMAPWPGNPNPGVPDSGSLTAIFNGAPLSALIPINPNPNLVTPGPYSYNVTVVDICGNKIVVA